MNITNGYYHIVGATDTGCVRKANEDSLGWLETKNGMVAVVCDGMGGHVGGATASTTAVETILQQLGNQYYEDPRIAIGDAIDRANKAILHKAKKMPELRGMGSTVVLLLIREGLVYIGSVGDSRIYLIRNHTIHQLTKDHSYVQMLIDMGQITSEEAEVHPRRNEITNALGIAEMKPATILQDAITPEAGDCFLLCSDGLTGMISNKEIAKVISKQGEMGAQDRADLLIQKAKIAGGLDNITVEIVEFSVTPSTKKPRAKKRGMILLILSLLLTTLMAIYFIAGREKQGITNVVSSINISPSDFEYGQEVVTLIKEENAYSLYGGKTKVTQLNELISRDSIDTLEPYLQYKSQPNGFKLIATGSVPDKELVIRLKGEETTLILTIPIKKHPEADQADSIFVPAIVSKTTPRFETDFSTKKMATKESSTSIINLGSIDFQSHSTFLSFDFTSGKDIKITGENGKKIATVDFSPVNSFKLCSGEDEIATKYIGRKRVELTFATPHFKEETLCFKIGETTYKVHIKQASSSNSNTIPLQEPNLKEKSILQINSKEEDKLINQSDVEVQKDSTGTESNHEEEGQKRLSTIQI
ncbi:MAG: Stp1/IreP family PP2C-type Ser/Thr phosphatase [Phocaeicola sp.]